MGQVQGCHNSSVAFEIDPRATSPNPRPNYVGNVEDMFCRAVEDAGMSAYGVVCVEVRVLNEELTELEVPEGGTWIDPVFIKSQPSDALSRLIDKTHPGYLPPEHNYPGVGLAGMFWAEAHITVKGRVEEYGDEKHEHLGQPPHENRIRWRETSALAADPDQPPSARLKAVAEAGIGLAGAVRFDCQDRQGVVIFGARESVDRNKLESETNVNFLCSATNMIAASVP